MKSCNSLRPGTSLPLLSLGAPRCSTGTLGRRRKARMVARGPILPECAREIKRDQPLRFAITPATHLLRPHVGVASGAGLTVRLDARGPSVDQGHVAQHAVGTSSMARFFSGEDLA